MKKNRIPYILPLIERPIAWVVRTDHPKIQGGVGYVIDNSGRQRWVAKTASSLAIVSKAETLHVLRAINDGVLTTDEAMSLRRLHAPIIPPWQVDDEFNALASAYNNPSKAEIDAYNEHPQPSLTGVICLTTVTSGTVSQYVPPTKLPDSVETGYVDTHCVLRPPALVPAVQISFHSHRNNVGHHVITMAAAKVLRDQLDAILND